MLDAFKLKPYDLEPVFATWTDGPIFRGNHKKDPPIDAWLDQIKAGCEERKIPEEYWYKVAQHFMGKKAKARLDELKAVIDQVHGNKYRWTWKKFKVAMQNMGWGIEKTKTETIKVQKAGSWWTLRKREHNDASEAMTSEASVRPTLSHSETSIWSKKMTKEPEEAPLPPIPTRSDSLLSSKDSVVDTRAPPRRAPSRSASDIFWPVGRHSKDEAVVSAEPSSSSNTQHPVPSRSKRANTVMVAPSTPHKPPIPPRSDTTESGSVTTVTQAPVWLLNACSALEYITSEHPKAMSVISAILITAGSIPALPAISAGAGGAVLASGAAHAIGAIAVGLGQALSVSVKNQQGKEAQASTTVQ